MRSKLIKTRQHRQLLKVEFLLYFEKVIKTDAYEISFLACSTV